MLVENVVKMTLYISKKIEKLLKLSQTERRAHEYPINTRIISRTYKNISDNMSVSGFIAVDEWANLSTKWMHVIQIDGLLSSIRHTLTPSGTVIF